MLSGRVLVSHVCMGVPVQSPSTTKKKIQPWVWSSLWLQREGKQWSVFSRWPNSFDKLVTITKECRKTYRLQYCSLSACLRTQHLGERRRENQEFTCSQLQIEVRAILGYMRSYFNHALLSQKYILWDNWTFKPRMLVTKRWSFCGKYKIPHFAFSAFWDRIFYYLGLLFFLTLFFFCFMIAFSYK